MRDNLMNRSVPVPTGVLQQLTKLPVRQAFPDHRHVGRWQMPVGRSRRRMQSSRIVFLMTSAAYDRIRSASIGSAPDLQGMRMAVVSLPGKVSAGMAVHAARVMQYRNDPLEGSGRGPITGCRLCRCGHRNQTNQ
jgi:hypothetical protein